MLREFRSLLILSAIACSASSAAAQSPEIDFFETKIRPVLVEHCYSCHSATAKKVRGSLLLDSRDGLRKGGESGAVLVLGQPDKSPILDALRHDGIKMPPNKKLPAEVAADFERWIKAGAVDPRTTPATKAAVPSPIDPEARKHWAFQPIKNPALPAVKNSQWVQTPLDAFILAKLEAKGLTPSPTADPRTLLRRIYFDLVGLPPSPEEVAAFSRDPSPTAFAAVVDRLLASPQYGERWGRHWLDVARFADTKDGVLMFGDDRIRPYAYTYRDYVVRAMNEDVPYNKFIEDQLAADQLYAPAKAGEVGPQSWRLAAMGFLTLGRMFDGNVPDVIDDRIDVVSRGLLGLTVSCARCHNHKYDPIPTADYYSIYGIFASCDQPVELPLIAAPDATPAAVEFEKKSGQKRQELIAFHENQYALLSEQVHQRVGDYLVHVATTAPDPLETAIFFLSLAPSDLRPPVTARWRRFLEQNATADDPVFGLWHDLMALPDDGFKDRAAKILAARAKGDIGIARGATNPLVLASLQKEPLTNKADVARRYGSALRHAYDESKKLDAAKIATMPPEQKQLVDLVAGRDSPCYFPKSQTRRYMSRGETDSFGGKLTELDRIAVKAPAAPPRAMILADEAEPVEPRVFLRGNPSTLGPKIPRQFLAILSPEERRPFAHGGGRLDLARAIADPNNPLTNRVLVNRVWMHHFGEPLVATPSDFGLRTAPPTHPELLDHLAAAFMADGWSLKKLHRRIVLSAAYQQASLDRKDAHAIDPDNRLLWKMNRRRLDLEAMRDSLLAVSGRLDLTLGGRPVDIVNDPQNRRRTLYSLIDRQSLPGLFRSFDFAVPDTSVERRPQTTVPQQALFALNSAFMMEQAKSLAGRIELPSDAAPEARVVAIYRLALGREPQEREIAAAVRFLSEPRSGTASPLSPLQQLAQAVLMTNEFAFVE